MKRMVVTVFAVVASLAVFGCQQQDQKKQQQMNYAPPPMPAMPTQLQVNQLQEAATAAPKNPQAWIALGDAMMDSQRFSEAVEAYQKGLALDPKNVPARVDMGTCYRGLGKFDKAVEEYRKALKIEPNFPNGHRNMAVVLGYDLHKTSEGLAEFKKYLDLAPNAPDAPQVRQAIQELSSRPAGK